MDLNSILKEMERDLGGATKTASHGSSNQNSGHQAPAQSSNAVNDLLKVAAELSGAEKQAELAHAHMMGQAMADAAISRFGMYQGEMDKIASEIGGYTEADVEQATVIGYQHGIDEGIKQAAAYLESQEAPAPRQRVKQASYAQAASEEAEMQKWAEYVAYGEEKLAAAAEVLSPDDLLKYAAQQGLTPVLEKMAEDYDAGYKQAEEEIAEQAKLEFLKGAAEAEIMIDFMVKRAEGKVPAGWTAADWSEFNSGDSADRGQLADAVSDKSTLDQDRIRKNSDLGFAPVDTVTGGRGAKPTGGRVSRLEPGVGM